LFPEKSLNEEEVLKLRLNLMSKAGRSLVLTPSIPNAEKVIQDVKEHLKFRVFTAKDLEVSKTDFTQSEQAAAVIANRYDGIDFPDDDCRLLFIEGLSRTTNLQERFLMNRMGASLLFNERIQTRVFQAIGRCTRGMNDYSAVVITGNELSTYLTDRKRRTFFHPELQAELEFGLEQSTEVQAQDLLDNFSIFLDHDQEWEKANQSILNARETATQVEFPAVNQLEKAVVHEIAWQTAMWNEDYVKAYDAARDVLAELNDSALRGYRALWHYLAGASAQSVASAGSPNFEALARDQYRSAKNNASCIPWLIGLASWNAEAVSTPEEIKKHTLLLQVEQLEVQLDKLGTLNNRKFSERENEIRKGLKNGKTFERAQLLLGEHLGFIAGKREVDASPDPWWIVGDITFVFEDHANASSTSEIDATKARQAASHPNWIREHVPESKNTTIQSVLVTPAAKAKEGAIPHLGNVAHWNLEGFRQWADQALVTIRDLRRNFNEPGDLAWRAQAAETLEHNRLDAPGLLDWLSARPARDYYLTRIS
jgi:hypothetical protein